MDLYLGKESEVNGLKGKSLLTLGILIGAPIIAGFINSGLQLFLIGVDVGIIGTFAYISIALYRSLKGAGDAMKAGIDAMKKIQKELGC